MRWRRTVGRAGYAQACTRRRGGRATLRRRVGQRARPWRRGSNGGEQRTATARGVAAEELRGRNLLYFT